MPRTLFGVDVMDEAFLSRYREYWSWAGFGVKAVVVPETRWRMATFLGMRPVWSGIRYEWMPEPARRLKGAFWQIDNNMHWESWGRGIATQLVTLGGPCPVLGDIARWYLDVTKGPIGAVEVNIYNPFHTSVASGGPNERADREFCVDYRISMDALQNFRRHLKTLLAPLVDLHHHVIDRVVQEES